MYVDNQHVMQLDLIICYLSYLSVHAQEDRINAPIVLFQNENYRIGLINIEKPICTMLAIIFTMALLQKYT